MEVPTVAAYLQENEYEGPLTFFWLFDVAANIPRTWEGSHRKAYLYTVFKGLVAWINSYYRSKPIDLHQGSYSWFRWRFGVQPNGMPVVFGLRVSWFCSSSLRCPGIKKDNLLCGIIVSDISSTLLKNSCVRDILQVHWFFRSVTAR